MTDTREDVARRLLAVVTLGKRVAEVEKALRQLAREQFVRVGQREVGAVGDVSLGTVQLDRGSTTWACTDEAALLKWVAEHWPSQIETTRRVRPAYVEALRQQIAKRGAACTDDGEVIPGFTCSTSDPKLVVKAAADAAEMLDELYSSGRLTFHDFKVLGERLEAAS